MGFKEALSKARRSKKARIGFLIILLAILLILAFYVEKAKIMFIIFAVIIAGAIGLEVFDYDLDLETLWDTGSVQDSRVENKNGVKLIGQCISNNLNCSNFDTQQEAQDLYNTCAEQIKEKNKDITDVISLDIYGLDGNKNGIVCEALPQN